MSVITWHTGDYFAQTLYSGKANKSSPIVRHNAYNYNADNYPAYKSVVTAHVKCLIYPAY